MATPALGSGDVFSEATVKMGETDTTGQRQPGCGLNLIFQKHGLHITRESLLLLQVKSTPIGRTHSKQRRIPLIESIVTCLGVVASCQSTEENLSARITGVVLVARNDWPVRILRP